MCKANADALSKESQRALNRAILVMVLPPVCLMLGGATLAWRFAKRRDNAATKMRGTNKVA